MLPLFPQYCGATTGAVFDQVSARAAPLAARCRELHFVADYHDHPGYIEALRGERRRSTGRPTGAPHTCSCRSTASPSATSAGATPTSRKCQTTARLLADELLLKDGEWSVSFQSRFGPADWLKPYTRDVLAGMPGARRAAR